MRAGDRFLSILPEWEQKNLKIFWLPTYSPKLNLIEILWKFTKYEWIEVDAYASLSSLIKYLRYIFRGEAHLTPGMNLISNPIISLLFSQTKRGWVNPKHK